MDHLYETKDLMVSFTNEEGKSVAVNGVSFYLDAGEIISFVGESGSGKSVTQLAALQLIASPPGKIESGQVLLDGEDVLAHKANSAFMSRVRGGQIGMIFQEPMSSLNPVKTIGFQLMESIVLHSRCSKAEAKKKAVELLTDVGISDAEARLADYPHQFSGGMRQRIMIAIAISGNPRVIVADEPTTALDVTTQAQILDLLKGITKKHHTALLIVTHNLGIVARYAQRIYVMYAGAVVESGRSEDLFRHPSHPYTRGLLKAVPRLDDPRDRKLIPIDGTPQSPSERPAGCPFHPRCPYACEKCRGGFAPALTETPESGHFSACLRSREELDEIDRKREAPERTREKKPGDVILKVQDLKVEFPIKRGILQKKVGSLRVLERVNFQVRRAETLGIVGESGCGKTTVAKSVLRLLPEATGKILFDGKDLSAMEGERLRRERRRIQMIFQDPYGSLDPRKTVASMVGEPLMIHNLVNSHQEYQERVDELLKMVGLDPSLQERYAHEFSGGQRQRVGIARALASNPDLIVCDEPISALDVSIQAQIMNLLEELQKKLGLTYLFIAHDLSVVKHISDTIAVMYLGGIVEFAPCEKLYEHPMHPYTQALLAAVPIADPEIERERERRILPGEVPSIVNRPNGCAFCNRCPLAVERCHRETPAAVEISPGHFVACHLADGR